MNREDENLLKGYWDWLRANTSTRREDGLVEIVTPFLDRHNDCLPVYVRREGEGFVLTDLGRTVEDLELSGFPLTGAVRQELFQAALDRFGVRANGKALEVHATPANFGEQKHFLLQAMIAVNDLYNLAYKSQSSRPSAADTFQGNVGGWLDESRIPYSADVQLAGKSGFSHHFDFVVPHSGNRPERVVEAVSHPSRTSVSSLVFAWLDTKDERPTEVSAFALLNDTNGQLPEHVEDALASYGIRPIPWRKHDALLEELSG